MAKKRRVRKKSSGREYIPAPLDWQILPADPAVIEQTGAAAYADEANNAVRVRGRMRMSDPVDRFIVANEVANLLDYKVLTDRDRQRFARIMNMHRRPWDGEAGGRDAFSDYFASYAAGTGTSVMGDVSVNPKRLKRFANALERLGTRNHLPQYRGF